MRLSSKPLIGIFGGTFDPVHRGHLGALALLSKELKFQNVYWVLSARPPHKGEVSASIEQRFTMLQLALAGQYGDENYIADDTEIKRSGTSYMLETVQAFSRRFPDASLCLIIGGDSLLELHRWYEYEQLIALAHIIVLHRPGYQLRVPDYLQPRLLESVSMLQDQKSAKLAIFKHSQFDVSSTRLRAALSKTVPSRADEQLISQYVSPEVLNHIRQQNIYQPR